MDIRGVDKVKDNNKRVLMGRVNRYRYCEIEKMCRQFSARQRSIRNVRDQWAISHPGEKRPKKPRRTRYHRDWDAYMTKKLTGLYINEFNRFGFVARSIVLEYDGKLRESVLISAFRYNGFINEEWENSKFRRWMKWVTFLFIIYKRDSHGDIRLIGSQCWEMPPEDIEQYVKPVWEKTKEVIESGSLWYVDRRGKRHYNFTSKKENPVCHIRDCAWDNKDTNELPDGSKCQTRGFGLDNNYIMKQLNREFIEDELAIENGKLHIKKRIT